MKYSEAIREALIQKMREDSRVFVCGIGVPDPKGVFGSTLGLQEEFGEKRVFDTPSCENATMAMMIGAAMQGMRPVMVNQRVDFFLLALDQIINHASKWKWMFGGVQRIPLVVRLIVGRGWGQGPQHSQSMHALFGHIPGLKVVAPVSPRDAKGLLVASIEDDDPVIFIEHRRLYDQEGDVPEGLYHTPLGSAEVLRSGRDVTLVATSHMVVEATSAAKKLEREGVSAEVIDLRTIRPIDFPTIFQSVRRTGRLLVVDGDWKSCGIASEIVASVAEKEFSSLKNKPLRVTWPDMPVPTSVALEKVFYPGAREIYLAALHLMDRSAQAQERIMNREESFIGPF